MEFGMEIPHNKMNYLFTHWWRHHSGLLFVNVSFIWWPRKAIEKNISESRNKILKLRTIFVIESRTKFRLKDTKNQNRYHSGG